MRWTYKTENGFLLGKFVNKNYPEKYISVFRLLLVVVTLPLTFLALILASIEDVLFMLNHKLAECLDWLNANLPE